VRIRECRPLSALKRWEALYEEREGAKAGGAS
jgi:ribosomal protein S17